MSKVVRFHEHGGPEVLCVEEEVVGDPGPGEVRLRHEAIGVNPVDALFRTGAFPAEPPFVTGVEGAGLVKAVGPGVTDFRPGQRVAYFFTPGAYAEVRLIESAALTGLPDDVPSAIAAALFTKGLTAWMGLRDLYPVAAGERVLVQGASGGVGALLASWARAMGATVIGAGSTAKFDRVARVSDHPVSTDDPNLSAAIGAISPGGVDVVYEFVGQATFSVSAAAVRDGGTIVMIGAASGQPRIDRADLERRGVRLVTGRTAESVRGRVEEAAQELFSAYRAGVFGSVEIERYPLTSVARAHEDLAARRIRGSAILIP